MVQVVLFVLKIVEKGENAGSLFKMIENIMT